MTREQNKAPAWIALAAMVTLILDSQTAIQGAADAVQLCIRTAIPSLFPFFVLSGLLVPYASKLRLPVLGKLLGIPAGWESIFILGCLGGYPVGSQCIAQAYTAGKLDRAQAQRMLGFCTNCGPSFIFGIVGRAFAGPWAGAAIQVIHILSALLVGCIWPTAPGEHHASPELAPISLTQAIRQALRSMSSVCAWIILGKVLLAFLSKWFLHLLPGSAPLLVTGLLELTNGCLSLNGCADEAIRFLIACTFVSFGGICVAMQVGAICHEAGLNTRTYLLQKALQAGIAAILAAVYLRLPGQPVLRICLTGLGGMILLPLCKMAVEIPCQLMYNIGKKGGTNYAVPKEN